jgi:hypothetical protein
LVEKKEKREKKEVFDLRKRRKGTNILTYQLEGTLVLDTPLAVVYICANHNYLLFLVLDHPGTTLRSHVRLATVCPLESLFSFTSLFLNCFLRHHILPSKLHFHPSFAGFLFAITPHSIVVHLILHLRHL